MLGFQNLSLVGAEPLEIIAFKWQAAEAVKKPERKQGSHETRAHDPAVAHR